LPEIDVSDCEAFTRDVVYDVEDATAPAVGELVVDEVERPACGGLSLDEDRCACHVVSRRDGIMVFKSG
jgi:hypothetical protein